MFLNSFQFFIKTSYLHRVNIYAVQIAIVPLFICLTNFFNSKKEWGGQKPLGESPLNQDCERGI